MSTSPIMAERDAPAARTVRLRIDVLNQVAARLGAHTLAAQAEWGGVDRGTLRRWRDGDTVPPLDQAVRFADRFGLSVTQLWSPWHDAATGD